MRSGRVDVLIGLLGPDLVERLPVVCRERSGWPSGRSNPMRLRTTSRPSENRFERMNPSEVTQMLEAVGRGEACASVDLLPLVYDELRRHAAGRMAREAAGQTMQPTALVHEAWLR